MLVFGVCETSWIVTSFFQQHPDQVKRILVCCLPHRSSSSFPNHHDMFVAFVGFPLVKKNNDQKKDTCEGLHVCSQSEKNPTLWRGQDEGETGCAWQLVGLFVVVGVNLQPRQFHLQKIVQLKFFGSKTHVMVLSMRLGWTNSFECCGSVQFFRLFPTHSNKIISTYWSIDPWTSLYHVKGFHFLSHAP